MAEEKNVPVPEEKKQEAVRPESELAAELERARSRNKILKIVAAVLAVLFLALAAAAFVAYRKISQAKAEFISAFQNYQPAAQPEGLPMPGALASVAQSTEMAASGLGLISGSIPGQQAEAFNPAEGEKLVNVLAKYSNRPVVKEFLAELKKDPDIARALAQTKGGNPMAVMASVKNSKGINGLMIKYMARPDFLKFMMEAMRDPDLKPFMKGMPGAPVMPQAVPVAAVPAEEPAQEEQAGSLTLDPSAMNAPAVTTPANAAPARAQKVPPPVDTQ